MRWMLCVWLSGCSFAFANHRASHAQTPAECPGYTAPIVDSVVATELLVGAARSAFAPNRTAMPVTASASSVDQGVGQAVDQALAAPVESPGVRDSAIGLGVVLATAYAISAATGYAAVHACHALEP